MVVGTYEGVPAVVSAGNVVTMPKKQLINRKFSSFFGWWDDTDVRTVYDLFDDASYDTSLWTTGTNVLSTLTEADGRLKLDSESTSGTAAELIVDSDNAIEAGRSIFMDGISTCKAGPDDAGAYVTITGSTSGSHTFTINFATGLAGGFDSNIAIDWALLIVPDGANNYAAYQYAAKNNEGNSYGGKWANPFDKISVTGIVGDISIRFRTFCGADTDTDRANLEIDKVVYL